MVVGILEIQFCNFLGSIELDLGFVIISLCVCINVDLDPNLHKIEASELASTEPYGSKTSTKSFPKKIGVNPHPQVNNPCGL
jgi:hypothetical protein